MVDDEGIDAAPAVVCNLNGFPGDAEVGKVTGDDLNLFDAVLVAELVEGRGGARDEDQFVGVGEEVVGCCEADTLGIFSILSSRFCEL